MDPLEVKSRRGLGPHDLCLFKISEFGNDLLLVSDKLKQPSCLSGNNTYLHFNLLSCGGWSARGGEKYMNLRWLMGNHIGSAEPFRVTCHMLLYGEKKHENH